MTTPNTPPTAAQEALHYPDIDHQSLGDYYLRHVAAMTREGLHAKSDIAAQLAWRDREIDRLAALSPEVAESAGNVREALEAAHRKLGRACRNYGEVGTRDVEIAEHNTRMVEAQRAIDVALESLAIASQPPVAAPADDALLTEIDYAVHHGWPRESWGRLERIAARIKAQRAALAASTEAPAQPPVAAVPSVFLTCKQCGADRTKEDCKGNRMTCPMQGSAATTPTPAPAEPAQALEVSSGVSGASSGGIAAQAQAGPVSPEEVEALAHRMCWRYKHSRDPNHSHTYTFNGCTLQDFASALLAARPAPAEAVPNLSQPTELVKEAGATFTSGHAVGAQERAEVRGLTIPTDVRLAAERTREDLGPTGSNYPDIRKMLAFIEGIQSPATTQGEKGGAA